MDCSAFRDPTREICVLQTYWQQDENAERPAYRDPKGVQKVLTEMAGVQIANVISDISSCDRHGDFLSCHSEDGTATSWPAQS